MYKPNYSTIGLYGFNVDDSGLRSKLQSSGVLNLLMLNVPTKVPAKVQGSEGGEGQRGFIGELRAATSSSSS